MRKHFGFLIIVAFVGVGALFLFTQQKPKETFSLEALAKCLTGKGVVMYGADWCPHCQNEKKAFGKAFRFISYIECPKEPDRCLTAGVSGYPTWIFPDGRKLLGEQGPQKLAQESGCSF